MVKHRYLASEEITEYIWNVSAPEHPVLKKCREETSALAQARMQSVEALDIAALEDSRLLPLVERRAPYLIRVQSGVDLADIF